MRTHFDAADVALLIDHLAGRITAAHPPAAGPLTVVGIRTRGDVLADRLVPMLVAAGHRDLARGVLDITLYRDDLTEIGPRPMVRPTKIDGGLAGRTVVLVDDVIFTGRTVRAALDALADHGRPRAVRLAVLVDRGGRELPVQPDHAALVEQLVPVTHQVKVRLRERDGADEILIEPRDRKTS